MAFYKDRLRCIPGRGKTCEYTGRKSAQKFDVFLAHNHTDQSNVERIAVRLRERGIIPWLDKWHLPPGRLFQKELECVLSSIRSIAIFIGPTGIGPWETIEMRAAISEFVRREAPVIPVLLPGMTNDPPMFLREFGCVRFPDCLEASGAAVDQLVFGITGVNPAFATGAVV